MEKRTTIKRKERKKKKKEEKEKEEEKEGGEGGKYVTETICVPQSPRQLLSDRLQKKRAYH